MIIKSIITVALSICATAVYAQIEGLWEVKQVIVGKELMTPVAKWMRINSDFTYQSGNGWLQNAEGVWSLKNNYYLPVENNGIKDHFGPFKIKLQENKMTWIRMEDGDTVRIDLERIAIIPKGPADLVQGLWDLVSVTKGEEDLTFMYDPESNRYLFIRWDRVFVDDLGPDGRLTGYWQMHGHRPSLTLISSGEKKLNEVWKVEALKSTMIWMGESDTNTGIKMTFRRISEFPNN